MERRLCFWSLIVRDRTCSGGSSVRCSFPVEDFHAKEDEHQLSTVHGSDYRPSLGQEDCVKILESTTMPYGFSMFGDWSWNLFYGLRPHRYIPLKNRNRNTRKSSPRCSNSRRGALIAIATRILIFSNKTSSELNADRPYWGPWIVVQIVYPTVLAILDHPFL
jgi:hypothetical protein